MTSPIDFAALSARAGGPKPVRRYEEFSTTYYDEDTDTDLPVLIEYAGPVGEIELQSIRYDVPGSHDFLGDLSDSEIQAFARKISRHHKSERDADVRRERDDEWEFRRRGF